MISPTQSPNLERDLARLLTNGFKVHIPKSQRCCGSAGIYNMLQPKLAAEIGQRKAAHLHECAPDMIVTGNPGSMMHIDSHMRRNGHNVPVRHPVELLLPPQ